MGDQASGNSTGVRAAQAAHRRAQLLETGFDLFSQNGYRRTTVRAITQAAGVTEAVLYHYFGSKAELFAAVFERYAPVARYSHIIDETATVPLAEALQQLGREYLKLVRARRSFVATLLSEAPSEPDLARLLRYFLQGVVENVSRLLSERQARGEIEPRVDVLASAKLFQGALILHVLATVFVPDVDPAEFADDIIIDGLVAAILIGLAPRDAHTN